MNVWFSSNYTDWEEEVINHFKSLGKWNTVIWPSNFNTDKEFLDTSFHSELNFPEYSGVEKEIYDNLYKYLYVFMDMYSRNSPMGQNVYDNKNIHDYLNLFNLIINYYCHYYKKYNIELLILNRAPHVGHDLLRYLVAKELGIKTLIMEQSLFTNKFFYYFDANDYGLFETSTKSFQTEKLKVENRFEKELFYMKKFYQKKSLNERLLIHCNSPKTTLMRDLISKTTREQAFYRYNLKKNFSKMSKEIVTTQINLDRPYVYFALHLQPEKTTSSWGGCFTDQLLAIERLSDMLPEGWMIYVKENPKQTFFMRGGWFYKRFKAIKNAIMVPNDFNTYDLLKSCQFAATITGTVGWEAITGGKNVLIFGWGVWYKTLPGVFQYHPSFNIFEIVNYKINFSELEEGVNNLLNKMGNGVIYNKGEGYKTIVDGYSKENNIKNIIASLEKILE